MWIIPLEGIKWSVRSSTNRKIILLHSAWISLLSAETIFVRGSEVTVVRTIFQLAFVFFFNLKGSTRFFGFFANDDAQFGVSGQSKNPDDSLFWRSVGLPEHPHKIIISNKGLRKNLGFFFIWKFRTPRNTQIRTRRSKITNSWFGLWRKKAGPGCLCLFG